MTKRPKKQHYISQHYLRNFCTDDGKFLVYDKKHDRQYWSDIEDVAEENYFFNIGAMDFYDSLTEEQKQQIDEASTRDGLKPYSPMTKEERLDLEHSIDDKFSNEYEPQFADMISLVKSRIDEGKETLLNEKEKFDFAYLFVLHYVRTKYFRDRYIDMKVSLDKQAVAIMAQFNGIHTKPDDISVSYSKEQQRLLHLSAILDDEFINELSYILKGYIWQFISFDKGTLILPDCLANLCPTEQIIPMFPPSFTTYGMVIEIPLSKNLILVMFDYRKFKEFTDCQLIPFNILSNFAVKSSNRNSAVLSRNYVFSADKKSLDEAISTFKKELEDRTNHNS